MPELNTQGIDISNTLMRINQMETNRLQREHLDYQNALIQSKLDPNSPENQVEMQKAKRERIKAEQEDMAKGIGWIASQSTPEQMEKAYNQFRAVKIKENPTYDMYLPPSDVFYKPDISGNQKKFDMKLFRDHATKAQLANENKLHPQEGKPFTVTRKNTETGTYEDVQMMYENGNLTELGAVPVEKWGEPVKQGRVVTQINKRTGEQKKIYEEDKPKQQLVTYYNIKDPNKTIQEWIEEGTNPTAPVGYTSKTPWKPEKENKMDDVSRQELIGIRQDKRSLTTEINKIKKLPNIDFYKDVKATLPDLQTELEDLNTRERELTGVKVRNKKTIIGKNQELPSMPDAKKYPNKIIRDTVTNERYKSINGQWVKQ